MNVNRLPFKYSLQFVAWSKNEKLMHTIIFGSRTKSCIN